jgi:hypothetical protein
MYTIMIDYPIKINSLYILIKYDFQLPNQKR